MKATELIWTILFIILFTMFSYWIWTNHPKTIPDISLQAKQACIHNNGIPILDAEEVIIDCKIYKPITTIVPTQTPTPRPTLFPTPIPFRQVIIPTQRTVSISPTQ